MRLTVCIDPFIPLLQFSSGFKISDELRKLPSSEGSLYTLLNTQIHNH